MILTLDLFINLRRVVISQRTIVEHRAMIARPRENDEVLVAVSSRLPPHPGRTPAPRSLGLDDDGLSVMPQSQHGQQQRTIGAAIGYLYKGGWYQTLFPRFALWVGHSTGKRTHALHSMPATFFSFVGYHSGQVSMKWGSDTAPTCLDAFFSSSLGRNGSRNGVCIRKQDIDYFCFHRVTGHVGMVDS